MEVGSRYNYHFARTEKALLAAQGLGLLEKAFDGKLSEDTEKLTAKLNSYRSSLQSRVSSLGGWRFIRQCAKKKWPKTLLPKPNSRTKEF